MKKAVFVISLLFLGVAIGLWLRHNGPVESQSDESPTNEMSGSSVRPPIRAAPSTQSSNASSPTTFTAGAIVEERINQIKAEIERGLAEWRTPIAFYGKVVDENTNPIVDADVHFVWTDLSSEGSSEKHSTSDNEGLFSLRNEAGKHLRVQVSKEGYYAYQPFGATFFFAGENENFIPDALNPVVFRLKKKGVPDPLIHIQSPMGGPKGFRIDKDGNALEISLVTGKSVPLGQGDLRVQCWTESRGKTPGQRYDWKCQISVPSGGILVSTNELDFQAPSGGYQSADVIDMPANLETEWSSHASRNYFLKLANGTYARMSFEMVAGGDHFFQLESFLNPSGSPNLEFDPTVTLSIGN